MGRIVSTKGNEELCSGGVFLQKTKFILKPSFSIIQSTLKVGLGSLRERTWTRIFFWGGGEHRRWTFTIFFGAEKCLGPPVGNFPGSSDNVL